MGRGTKGEVLPFLLLLLLLLSSSCPAATVSWIAGSGDWNTPANWSTGALPGPDDDVVIDQPAEITVTHVSGTNSVNSPQCEEALVLSGGSFTVANTVQDNRSTLASVVKHACRVAVSGMEGS